MEINIELGRLSVEGGEIDRNTLLEKLRGKFEDDVASALLEEIEKRAKEKGVSLRR
jgi:sensor histidine kinase regulating citrate/malate metabolism